MRTFRDVSFILIGIPVLAVCSVTILGAYINATQEKLCGVASFSGDLVGSVTMIAAAAIAFAITSICRRNRIAPPQPTTRDQLASGKW